MTTYFKTPFTIGSEYYYIEAKVPKASSSSSNIICCVDVSGSIVVLFLMSVKYYVIYINGHKLNIHYLHITQALIQPEL
jgi:hypothetical protein